MAVNPPLPPGVQPPPANGNTPGFPTPGVDPRLFFIPAASSFFTNILLFDTGNLTVPIDFGPIPANLGLPPVLFGASFFPASATTANPGGLPAGDISLNGISGNNFMNQMNNGAFGGVSPNLGNNFGGGNLGFFF